MDPDEFYFAARFMKGVSSGPSARHLRIYDHQLSIKALGASLKLKQRTFQGLIKQFECDRVQ